MTSGNLLLFSGSANQPLAQGIARALDISPGQRDIQRFPDGELRVELRETVRGQDVYLLQPTCVPVAENLLELLLMADAARRAGAGHLTAVIPYFGYDSGWFVYGCWAHYRATAGRGHVPSDLRVPAQSETAHSGLGTRVPRVARVGSSH